MSKEKSGSIEVKAFTDHHVITPPNPLRKVLHRVIGKDPDDPVARAEKSAGRPVGRIPELDGDRSRPALGRARHHSQERFYRRQPRRTVSRRP